MTARKFKSATDPVFSHRKSEEHCDHLVEAHTIYDREAAGYRAQARCPCRKVCLTSRRLHEKVATAEQEAKDMLVRRDREIARKKAARLATKRRIAEAIIERKAARAEAPPVIDPGDEDKAWLVWWRSTRTTDTRVGCDRGPHKGLAPYQGIDVT